MFTYIDPPTQVQVPENERMAYNAQFGQLWRYAADLESKMPICAIFFKEEAVKRLLEIVRVASMDGAP